LVKTALPENKSINLLTNVDAILKLVNNTHLPLLASFNSVYEVITSITPSNRDINNNIKS
jgi:hypothetical protein